MTDAKILARIHFGFLARTGLFAFLAFAIPFPAGAADISVVPVDGGTSRQVSPGVAFTIRNDGLTPALFRLSARKVGFLPLADGRRDTDLIIEPAEVLLLPGAVQPVTLRVVAAVAGSRDFQVYVEQAPVLFSPPGQGRRQRDMTLHRSTLSYTVAGDKTVVAAALSDIGR